MSDIKNEDIKSGVQQYPKNEYNASWNHNPTPIAYNAKTEEEPEDQRFFCAVCEHSAYSIEVCPTYIKHRFLFAFQNKCRERFNRERCNSELILTPTGLYHSVTVYRLHVVT